MFGRATLALLIPEGDVRIDAARCVRRRFSPSDCASCANVCPHDAITFENDPRLDATRCSACRRCEAVCPVGAIEGDSKDLAALATELAKYADPLLGCRVHAVKADVRTGCLGFLDVEAMVALGLALPQGVTLNLSRCNDCRNASIVPELEASLGEANRLLGEPARVRLTSKPDRFDAQQPSLSRRGFFTAVGKRCADAAASIAPKLAETLPSGPDPVGKSLPDARRLLVRKLVELPLQDREWLGHALFPQLSFGPACDNCTGCDGMCPTGAISTSRDDPPRPLFHPALCTGCGVCAAFCPKRAIDIVAAVPVVSKTARLRATQAGIPA